MKRFKEASGTLLICLAAVQQESLPWNGTCKRLMSLSQKIEG
jgi:hypothetical protein